MTFATLNTAEVALRVQLRTALGYRNDSAFPKLAKFWRNEARISIGAIREIRAARAAYMKEGA